MYDYLWGPVRGYLTGVGFVGVTQSTASSALTVGTHARLQDERTAVPGSPGTPDVCGLVPPTELPETHDLFTV